LWEDYVRLSGGTDSDGMLSISRRGPRLSGC
jgi:hypothetical protein